MGFVFALRAVLTVRRQREEAAERALAEEMRELAEARRAMEWVRGEVERAAAERDGAAAGAVPALEMRERYARKELLEAAQGETRVRLERAEERAKSLRESYLAARREREVMEEMEARQRTFHDLEALRREAKRTDDLLLGRRLWR